MDSRNQVNKGVVNNDICNSMREIRIPPPPPLPNFVYSNEDSVSSSGSPSGSDSLELEEMEGDNMSEGTMSMGKSNSGSFLSDNSDVHLLPNVNDVHQNLLVNLHEAYKSMKVLCFHELSSDLRPNIKQCWMMYLKEFTDITEGLVCAWKNPESTTVCEEVPQNNLLKLRIIELDSENMTAVVEGVESLSGEDFPRFVPVWQLRPDIDSDRPMKFTLENLRLCRFFFEKLWFSWDTDDIVKFFEESLERRIQFLYDIEHGLLPTKEEKAIVEMIGRSRILEQRINEIERTEDFEDGSEESLLILLELQLEQEEIGNKLKRLENPVLRMLMKKLELVKLTKHDQPKFGVGEMIFLVCVNSTPKEMKKVLQIIESKFRQDDVNIQVVNSLEVALEACPQEGTIFLTPGNYPISGLKNFEYGGRVVGIPLDGKQIVFEQSEMSAVWLMMDLKVQSMLYFENIVFKTEFYDDLKNDREDYESGCKTQVAMLIKDGHLHMENCVVAGRYEQMEQECHEITHSVVVRVAEGGNGMFTHQNSQFNNVKCLYWKDGKNQVTEKSVNIDWKIK